MRRDRQPDRFGFGESSTMRKSATIPSKTSANICVFCNEAYELKDINYEQRMVADTDFCPTCWQREITSFSDGIMDFAFLEGLVRK